MLPTILSSIDTLLCLHFASSTSPLTLHSLCRKATQLTKRRIDQSVLEQIVSCDPSLYKIVYTGTEYSDYGLCIPDGISLARFGASIPQRKASLEKVIKGLQSPPISIKLASIVEKETERLDEEKVKELKPPLLATTPFTSPVKNYPEKKGLLFSTVSPSASPSKKIIDTESLLPVTPTKRRGAVNDYTLESPTEPPESPTKPNRLRTSPTKISRLSSTLTNSPKKFLLKQKPVEPGGFSLLERIKQKEKLRDLDRENYSPEKVYRSRVLSKLHSIYDIIYELSSSEESPLPQFKTLSLPKLVSMIKDSLTLNVSEQEVEDALLELEKAIPERFLIFKQGGIQALKVFKLSRNDDLKSIDKAIKTVD